MSRHKEGIMLTALLNNKQLLQDFINKKIDIKTLINFLKEHYDPKSYENVALSILKSEKIKYFRDRFYIYNGLIWKLQEDHNHRKIKKIIYKTMQNLGIPYYTRFIEEVLELIFTICDTFKNPNTRYKIYLFKNGTLYYDQENCQYRFKTDYFPEDEIRDDENPMFGFDFTEDEKPAQNIVNIFNDWCGDAKQLLEIIKYSLFQKGNPYHKCFYLQGAGRNGKSQFLKLLDNLFPPGTITHLSPAKITGDKDGSETLEKSYINSVSEVSFVKFDMTIFKNILGNEPIMVNPKFRQPIIIYPSCKFILASNDKIHLRSSTEGDWRRFIQIPFNNKFSIDYTFFEKKMRPYIPSLFTYCLNRSFSLWKKKNALYLNSIFLRETKEEILGISSTVFSFIKEYNIRYNDKQKDCRYMYRTYIKFTERNRQHPVSSNRFWIEMQNLIPGYKPCYRRHFRYLDCDIRLEDWMEGYQDEKLVKKETALQAELIHIPEIIREFIY